VRDLVTGGTISVVWISRLERGSLADGRLDLTVPKEGSPKLERPCQGCTSLGHLVLCELRRYLVRLT
jgi:hypothetical protein